MDTLENYLASEYLTEIQEIRNIDRALDDVAITFRESFDRGAWPYELRRARPTPEGDPKISHGTIAMILAATGRARGYCTVSDGNFAKLLTEGADAYKEGVDPLIVMWKKGLLTLTKDLDKSQTVTSSTFNDDNPITLSHVSDLYKLLSADRFSHERKILSRHMERAKENLKAILAGSNVDLIKPAPDPKETRQYCASAFVPLRALRIAKDLDLAADSQSPFQAFFESTLHDHLSFSSIPDSRFDPAELAFCLEGLLLCAPESVDASLFKRVLQVLAEKQNTSAHWRPSKPFLASSTGWILLPISVEVANSLMRSIAISDENRSYDTFTAIGLPLVLRFWHWLRARMVRFNNQNQQPCVGWHSEHVNEPNLIHIWDTSQVTEFMFAFKQMLQRHIATKSLRLSRLNVKLPKLGEKQTAESRQSQAHRLNAFRKSKATTSGRVYQQIEKDFVQPWNSERPTHFSMLLYGPPGTGKTRIADELAKAIRMPLITVTVSDFLGLGGANVEARAKAIFLTLEAQEKCVIIFDEIDSFLLNRNSELYRLQDSLFQFLTPGMLTKIADLRKQERSIFIISTNYADRIDPAIKRTGRIDKEYQVPLPMKEKRLSILAKAGLKELGASRQEIERCSAFFGYSDLQGAALEAGGENATPSDFLGALRRRSPATSLESYLLRLSSDEIFPANEFAGLIKIAEEISPSNVEGIGSIVGRDGPRLSAELQKAIDLIDEKAEKKLFSDPHPDLQALLSKYRRRRRGATRWANS